MNGSSGGSSGNPYKSGGKGKKETAKVNYVQYGKSSKRKSKPGKFQQPTVNGSSGGSSGNPSKSGGKGKKVPLPTDICWRCGKG